MCNNDDLCFTSSQTVLETEELSIINTLQGLEFSFVDPGFHATSVD